MASDGHESKSCDSRASLAEEPSLIHNDPEKGLAAVETEKAPATTVVAEQDALLVTWAGDDDPQNPQNWPKAQKWAMTLLTSLGGLICLTSTTMLAPALGDIAHDLDVSQEGANMSLSIFVLAFAFGPMVLAPLAEIFGRRNVWLCASLWYTSWSIVCGFANSNAMLLAGRVFAGLGSSAEFAISQPVLADCWPASQRGHSFAIATFIPLLGPSLGPVLGGLVSNSIGWRWLFRILSIADGVLIVYAIFFFRETYAPVILRRKAARLAAQTGKPYYTAAQQNPLHVQLRNGLLRPTKLLVTQPIIQITGFFLAVNFGTLYLVLSSYATIWTQDYHTSVSVSGLHYLAIAIGYTIASQAGGRLTDLIYKTLSKRYPHPVPEFRVPLMLPGNLLIPCGLLWYGWAAACHAPWPVVDAGVVVFACGNILSTQAYQQYVMENYRHTVASAAAASQFLRSLFGFTFPLFAPALYGRLGPGFGNTALAGAFVALAVPAPFVLWFWGAKLRARGAKVQI